MGSGGGIIPACKLASRVFCVTAQKASLKGECGQPHSLFQEKVGRAPRGEIRSLGGGDAPIFRLPYFGSRQRKSFFLVWCRITGGRPQSQREEGILQMMAKSDKKRRRRLLHVWLQRASYFFGSGFGVSKWRPGSLSPQMEKQKISHQRARGEVYNGIHCECRFN